MNPFARGLMLLALVLAVSCGDDSSRDAGSPVPEESDAAVSGPFADWLRGREILRRGGNGKIDSEVLAVARTRVPLRDAVSGEARGWSEDEQLVAWVRYRHLDSSWTWHPDRDRVLATAMLVDGTPLPPAAAADGALAPDLATLGDAPPRGPLTVGAAFIAVYVFACPEEGKDVVLRPRTRRADGTTSDLVAVLVAASDIGRPRPLDSPR